jgi:hypothetical protein
MDATVPAALQWEKVRRDKKILILKIPNLKSFSTEFFHFWFKMIPIPNTKMLYFKFFFA